MYTSGAHPVATGVGSGAFPVAGGSAYRVGGAPVSMPFAAPQHAGVVSMPGVQQLSTVSAAVPYNVGSSPAYMSSPTPAGVTMQSYPTGGSATLSVGGGGSMSMPVAHHVAQPTVTALPPVPHQYQMPMSARGPGIALPSVTVSAMPMSARGPAPALPTYAAAMPHQYAPAIAPAPNHVPHPTLQPVVVGQIEHPAQRLQSPPQVKKASYVGQPNGHAKLITEYTNYQPTHRDAEGNHQPVHRSWDVDGDGKVSRAEIMAKLDKDGDGKLSAQEKTAMAGLGSQAMSYINKALGHAPAQPGRMISVGATQHGGSASMAQPMSARMISAPTYGAQPMPVSGYSPTMQPRF